MVPVLASSLPEKVYYAGYASNTDPARFNRYIAGGRHEGSLQSLPGCTDTTLPSDVQPITLDCEMYFSGYSHSWNGPTAYINPYKAGRTLAVAHLITRDQFVQVVAQESYANIGQIQDVLPKDLPTDPASISGTGNYDHMLYVGELNGWPVVTFTSPKVHSQVSKPPEAYLRTIGKGLATVHSLTSREIGEYFSTLAGVRNEYLQQDVVRIVDAALSVGPLVIPKPGMI